MTLYPPKGSEVRMQDPYPDSKHCDHCENSASLSQGVSTSSVNLSFSHQKSHKLFQDISALQNV